MARLAEFLVKEKLITEDALKTALDAMRKEPDFLGSILVKQGAIQEEALARALETLSGSPLIDLDRIELRPKLGSTVPSSFAEKHRCVPVHVDDSCVYVGAVDPTNVVAWDELAGVVELSVRTFTVRESQLKAAWKRVYVENESGAATTTTASGRLRAVNATTARFARASIARGEKRNAPPPIVPEEEFDIERLAAALEEVEVLTEEQEEEQATQDTIIAAAGDSPTVKLVNGFIYEAAEKGASDIHIEPLDQTTRVRYRIDGELRRRVELPRSKHRMIVSRLKIMAQLDIAERRLPQDGRVRMRVGERAFDLRISTVPVMQGEKIVIRLLGGTLVKESIDRLGMRARDLDRLRAAVTISSGMVLVTGPTGSGKTTTLNTVLRQLNTGNVNIMTAEDPVEYEQQGICQVQVKPQIGLTFASALRSFLRQDPDIIMVGEIRDLETAEISIKAALTGHLVLSTLHTNDAIWTIARLIDMGIPPFLVAAAVRCVVAQRLVRRLCPECREPAPETEYETFARLAPGLPRPARLYVAKGCGACGAAGYRGRSPVFEVFSLAKETVKRIVTQGARREELLAAARADAMKMLFERALELVEEGVTTLEEAWACCAT
jgi:type IV pilus assembly protein PilB